jgi:hypothetical protein
MGNSLSPVVSNIFIEHFEEMALTMPDYKPAKWLRYMDNTFVVWRVIQEFLICCYFDLQRILYTVAYCIC